MNNIFNRIRKLMYFIKNCCIKIEIELDLCDGKYSDRI